MRHDLQRHGRRRRISIHASRMGYDLRSDRFSQLVRVISIHASRMGCDSIGVVLRSMVWRISIHASRMGCDRLRNPTKPPSAYFNPRIPYGMRPCPACCRPSSVHFNPRIPYGMRLLVTQAGYQGRLFQSTHPVWDATHTPVIFIRRHNISIHASRMGCDYQQPQQPQYGVFQSTHPVFSHVFAGFACGSRSMAYFNPRIPYGMRPGQPDPRPHPPHISIHASRMGCDMLEDALNSGVEFQSTHPVWDATISDMCKMLRLLFQSTHPVWDATMFIFYLGRTMRISIHASRMGCDSP